MALPNTQIFSMPCSTRLRDTFSGSHIHAPSNSKSSPPSSSTLVPSTHISLKNSASSIHSACSEGISHPSHPPQANAATGSQRKTNRFIAPVLARASQFHADYLLWKRLRESDEKIKKALRDDFSVDEGESLEPYRQEYIKLNKNLNRHKASVTGLINAETQVYVEGKRLDANYIDLSPITLETTAEITTETSKRGRLIAGRMVNVENPDDMIAFSKLLIEKKIDLIVDLREQHERVPYHPVSGESESRTFESRAHFLPTCFANCFGSPSKRDKTTVTWEFPEPQTTSNTEQNASTQQEINITINEGNKTHSRKITLISKQTPDHQAIEHDILDETSAKINQTLDQEKSIYMHCHAGRGRTGQITTKLLVHQALTNPTQKDSISQTPFDEHAFQLVSNALKQVRNSRSRDMVNLKAYIRLVKNTEKHLSTNAPNLESEPPQAPQQIETPLEASTVPSSISEIAESAHLADSNSTLNQTIPHRLNENSLEYELPRKDWATYMHWADTPPISSTTVKNPSTAMNREVH